MSVLLDDADVPIAQMVIRLSGRATPTVLRAPGRRAQIEVTVPRSAGDFGVVYASRASLALGQSFERRMRIADLRREQMMLQSAAYQSSFAAGAAAGERERQRDDLAAFALVARSLRATTLPACNPCEKGFYNSSENVSSCTACPPGTTTAGTGSTALSACFSDVASTATAFLRINADGAYFVFSSTNSSYILTANGTDTNGSLRLNTTTTPPNVELNGPYFLSLSDSSNNNIVGTLANTLNNGYTVNIWAKSNTYNVFPYKEVNLFGIGSGGTNRALGLKYWTGSAYNPSSNLSYVKLHNMWYDNDLTIGVTPGFPDKTSLEYTSFNKPDTTVYHMFTVTWATSSSFSNMTAAANRRVYFDGVLVGSQSKAATTTRKSPNFDSSTTSRLLIGAFVNSVTSLKDSGGQIYIRNNIAGFRIWNRELSDTQISSLYSQGPM